MDGVDEKGHKETWGDGNVVGEVMVSGVCACRNRIAHFKYVQFSVLQLCLNEVEKTLPKIKRNVL